MHTAELQEVYSFLNPCGEPVLSGDVKLVKPQCAFSFFLFSFFCGVGDRTQRLPNPWQALSTIQLDPQPQVFIF